MKLLKRDISSKDGVGSCKLRCEEAEDMWHAFHLIGVGDRVRTTTMRKLVKEGSTGSVTSERVKITLTIQVAKMDFDSESCTLHLVGVNVEESAHVRLGAAHTLHLEMNRDFVLQKECFDALTLQRLEECLDPCRGAEVCAVALDSGSGIATLCLISGHMTIVRAKIEVAIPKKRAAQCVGASNNQGKALQRFYASLHRAVSTHVDFSAIKCVLLGSPGFAAADFLAFMVAAAVRSDERAVIENKARFVVCRASSGHKRAVSEMLALPEVASQLQDTRAVDDVRSFATFTKMLDRDSDRAYYGFNHVFKADELLAVDTLMVTDTLFKACDVPTRIKYVALVESVKAHGGTVRVFSSLHVSGEQLSQVSGIAAVLRFPLPEEAILDDDDDDDDDDDGGGTWGGTTSNHVFSVSSDAQSASAATDGGRGGEGGGGRRACSEVLEAEGEAGDYGFGL